jgi:MSHA pilin protein MshA
MKSQKGFTLIELVIVIVILGLLAATALPRFSNLTQSARVATLNGLAGGLRGAVSIARATQLVTPGLNSNDSVSMDGQTIAMTNGWPTAATVSNVLTDITGFTFTGANPALFTLVSGGNCEVRYTQSVAGEFPLVAIFSSGC